MFPPGNVRPSVVYSALSPLLNTNVNIEPMDETNDTPRMAMKFICSGNWSAATSRTLRYMCLAFDEHRGEALNRKCA